MAVRLLRDEVSELCLGKPELAGISASASISDALAAVKASGDAHVSFWVCRGENTNVSSCSCVGKFSVADVILYLCREENLGDPFKALEAPVSDLLPKPGLPIVRHLEADSSLLEAIDCIIEGTQNLVIPIEKPHTRNKFLNIQQASHCDCHCNHPYCWLTSENVARYLLNSIGAFSPIPTFSIDLLDLIDQDILTVPYNKPASSALGHLSRALIEQKPVAVVDGENRLIGEISPFTLACCDETAAAAVMALSTLDFMAYVEHGDPPEELIQLVKMQLEESNLVGLVELMDEVSHSWTTSSSSSCSSSDDESSSSGNGRSSRHARRSEAVVCSPGSSLVAVMIQALANRVPCVWVVEEDRTLVGAVTLAGILKALRDAAPGLA